MSELFLIAHKVRGEAAFDVATRLCCAECMEDTGDEKGMGCPECDSTGYWWIIPTSGHRAYPWWSWELDDLCDDVGRSIVPGHVPEMPEGLPDHYQTRVEPSRLAQLKAMLPPAKPIHRRF